MANKKVLICDDEPNIVESVSYVVKSSGYDCVIAENGAAALELAKTERPDLMILDVRMPKLSGNQVCEMLKDDADTRDIHIIMLTAYGQPQDKNFSMACGADEFVIKPFSPRELGARIKKVLGPALET
jgi:two-component system alkaline phosphatase synthesis response regulator PhoP